MASLTIEDQNRPKSLLTLKISMAFVAAFVAVLLTDWALPNRVTLILNIVLPLFAGAVLLFLRLYFKNCKFGFLKPFLISLCIIAPLAVGIKSAVYRFENGSLFVFMAVDFIIGFIVACVVTVRFGLMKDLEKGIVIGILIGTFFYVSILTDAYAKHFNYLFDSGEPTAYTVEITDKETHTRHTRGSKTSYYLEVRVEGKRYRIDVNESTYNSYEEGDPYSLARYQGAFGKPFVIPE